MSLTFDDEDADAFAAKDLLARYGLHATFYVNSGRIGHTGRMTLDQLYALRDDCNEIASHTVLHQDLASEDVAEQHREICDDRSALEALGFDIQSFAYPFSANDPTSRQAAIDCGVNSARLVTGLASPDCPYPQCPNAESIPPRDPFKIRAPPSIKSTTQLSDVQGWITRSEANGGGWVALVMHHVCDGCNVDAVSPSTLDALMQWLVARRRLGTAVRTVREVMGGNTSPAVAGPPAPPASVTGNLAPNASFEATDAAGVPDCWEQVPSEQANGSWTMTEDAYSGAYAQQLTVVNDGQPPPNLSIREDLGQCAPSAIPGQTYTASFFYKTTSEARFVGAYRKRSGAWAALPGAPSLAPTAAYTMATWPTAALPNDATAVSFGVTLLGPGVLVVDDAAIAFEGQTVTVSPATP